ncbi:MAG: hypothetical protein Q7T69_14810 [Rhodoferax sp.]|nr:hypothetical protein [Rhodoferax sp.]
MNIRRTPQQKKALSLERDRRNAYGERGANSRFAIARHKAKDLRRIRRMENAPLGSRTLVPAEDDLAEAQLRAVAHPPRSWKKSPDRPLAENVERKLVRRAAIAEAGGRRRARG